MKIEQNILDRAIAALSPRWGAQRMRARAGIALAQAGGYFGGGKGRRSALAGWTPGVGDANSDISPDLVDLRAYSRDLARTSALAGGAINTVVSKVVGTGLSCQPSPDVEFLGLSESEARAWIANTAREWRLWFESTDCDITRTQTGYGLQSLAFRSALESGDVFALPTMAGRGRPYKLALQLVEADRICNPSRKGDTDRLVHGIEIDAMGAPMAYHIADQHPGSRFAAAIKWTRVPAYGERSGRRNVLHLFDRRRPGQVRGVPYLAAVIEPLKQLTRYSEAEISAAVVSAAFAVFVKMDPEAFASLFDNDDDRATYLKATMKWDGSINAAGIDNPGKAVNLLPGESVESPEVGRPNAAFDPFVQAILRQIGVGLELPFEVLVKHFTASYSAARAALLDAWSFYRGRRDWLQVGFCQPVYELWLEEAVAIGRIQAPGFLVDPAYRRAWSTATWYGDGLGSLDPIKEANAADLRVRMGISTLSAESILYDGIDWEVKHAQRVREEEARRAAGLSSTAPVIAAPAAVDNPRDAGNEDIEDDPPDDAPDPNDDSDAPA